tara:strand:+ start:155 stop:904 length:750 start_codon:yes stop_codon:yes gene_type:complete
VNNKITIEHSHVYGEKAVVEITSNIKSIIYDTFLYTADEDYLQARFLALHGQQRLFYWSACQCIEKYLKAILLLSGESVKSFSHDISKIFQKAVEVDENLSYVSLNLPIELEELNLDWGSNEVSELISLINKHGDADKRYDYIGIDCGPSVLIKLDQLVNTLRTKITCANIFQHKKIDNQLLKHFHNYNYCFAPEDFLHGDIYHLMKVFRLTQSSLDIAVNGGYGYGHVYESWLSKNIKIGPKNKKFKK